MLVSGCHGLLFVLNEIELVDDAEVLPEVGDHLTACDERQLVSWMHERGEPVDVDGFQDEAFESALDSVVLGTEWFWSL
jgi:hypothetical protein